MASRPPGPPPSAPAPAAGGPVMGAGAPGGGAPGAAPGGAPGAQPFAGGPAPQDPGQLNQEIIKGVMAIGQQIEQSLISFAQAMPNGARFFQQASELIKQGIAAEISASGGGAGAPGGSEAPPAVSPTNAGPQFPGGGFGSGARP